MARITCEYCGTEYDELEERCPLCGAENADFLLGGQGLEAAAVEAAIQEPERPRRRAEDGEWPRRRAEDEERPRRRSEDEERPRRRAESGEAPRRRRTQPEADPAEEAPPRRRRRREKETNGDRIPRPLSILICIILGLAVVIGALYALYAVGVFSPSQDSGSDPSLSLPIEGDGTTSTGDTTTGSDTAGGDTTGTQTVACTGLTVSPASVRMEAAGIATAVTAQVLPADCTEEVVWTTSDPSICTVADGVITSVDGGTATVTATCGSFTAEVEVRCDFTNSQENNAYLSLTDFMLFGVGEEATIQVLDAPEGAEIAWSSSDSSVCTVVNGTVTARGGGTATVTATVGDRELTCTVRCNFESSSGSSGGSSGGSGYQLDHSDVTLGVGESFEISVVDGISGGWNVSDSSVITVDGNGIVTALASGTATVYTVINGERLECIVRVP